MTMASNAISRRAFILSGSAAAAAGGALLWTRGGHGLAAGESLGRDPVVRLSATPGMAPLLGSAKPAVEVWNYNGQVPGPEIRAAQGDRLRIVVENGLPEGTTVHWHGVRVPNAMDGVPDLTQDPISPGGSFIYDFPLHDAGTFWYHPHQRSFEQVGRGLYGPLIVEEANPIQVDRDHTWVLDDWRLDSGGQISGGFGSNHDATMAGRVGNTVTINGSLPQPLTVRTGERIRLRLINAANARIFGLNFADHNPKVIAIDGQPVEPHEFDGALLLGPAMRIDLILDAIGSPGSRSVVTDTFYSALEYPLTSIAYGDSPLRDQPLSTPMALDANPIPEPRLRNAQRHEIIFAGGMMGMMGGGMAGGMMGGGMGGGMMNWTVNGVSATGHAHEPILAVPRNQTVIMSLKNETAWWHPIHLHGHSFRVISRNGQPAELREWQDTVLMAPRETAEIAFVADNPGDWMIHCHILEHQAAGMMASIRVE